MGLKYFTHYLIDKLIEQELTFPDGDSSSCTPSGYAILTRRHYWCDFDRIIGGMEPPIFKENQFPRAKILRRNGYKTECINNI